MKRTTIPTFQQDSFCCPHCNVFAAQHWCQAERSLPMVNKYSTIKGLMVCICEYCNEYSFWYHSEMIFPTRSLAPVPHPSMPPEIKDDYIEAANILNNSPRGAAALLRLALQKLLESLGEPGTRIDSDIKSLVEKGLPKNLQQAFDIVRVVGNESVHPGSIDMKDNHEIAVKLFNLINIIVRELIAEPDDIKKTFYSLPTGKLEAIAKRDGITK
ncbi:DUF4145 domain-containing protein [Bacillus cereus]